MKELNSKQLQEINGGSFWDDLVSFGEKVGVVLGSPFVLGAKLVTGKLIGASREEIMEMTGLDKLNN